MIKLTKFNSTPEMDEGCTFTILERSTVVPEEKGAVTIAAFLEAKDKVNIYTLTGTVSDIANEFSDMIITQRGFQSNSKIITVGDEMLETLINMKR